MAHIICKSVFVCHFSMETAALICCLKSLLLSSKSGYMTETKDYSQGEPTINFEVTRQTTTFIYSFLLTVNKCLSPKLQHKNESSAFRLDLHNPFNQRFLRVSPCSLVFNLYMLLLVSVIKNSNISYRSYAGDISIICL